MNFSNIVKLTQKGLKKVLTNELQIMGYKPVVKDGFVYAKGTVPVMLIAHMDTVHRTTVKTICYSSDGSIIMSPEGIGGDDRCGVYAILEIIKEQRCHVLFCEDEEIGSQGAAKFVKAGITPKVNYLVEIDRRGSNDAVFYNCDNELFTKFVVGFGFEKQFGSFSDISVIAPDLGVAAVNISAGYFNEHNLHEHVDMRALRNNIERIDKMVATKSDKFLYIEGYRYSRFLSDYKFGDGKVNNFTRTIDTTAYKYKWLMELSGPDYVVDEESRMHDCDGDFYIDEKCNVYEYNSYIDCYIEADGYKAYRNEGFDSIFKPEQSDRCRVVTEDEAYLIENEMYSVH